MPITTDGWGSGPDVRIMRSEFKFYFLYLLVFLSSHPTHSFSFPCNLVKIATNALYNQVEVAYKRKVTELTEKGLEEEEASKELELLKV